VKKRNGKTIGEFIFHSKDSIENVKKKVHDAVPYLYPSRQLLTIGNDDKTKFPLKNTKQTLGELVKEGKLQTSDVLFLKDLGPQIGWATVFHVEYAGPILVHSLFFFFPSIFYPGYTIKPYSFNQKAAFALVVFHYLKREYETAFVHRFSAGSMPLFNLFKNSFHYWVLCGLAIAYYLYHPLYTPLKSTPLSYLFIASFLLAEYRNYHCHCILRDLRPPGTTVHGNPRGDLFEYVACANYTWEVLAWWIFAFFTSTLTAYFFAFVSTVQIALWAKKKGKQLPREPKGRKYLIPFVW